MGPVSLMTLTTPFRKARSVNSSSSSFPSKIPTTTEPIGDAGTAAGASVIELGGESGILGQNSALLVPYGLGSNNDGFSMRVIGWRRIRAASVLDLWVPVRLAEFACLMGQSVGIAGSAVLNTEAFCDTITVVTNMGNANVDYVVTSPQDDSIGHVVVSLKGFQRLELVFDQTTNTPTMNALVALL